MLQKLRELLTSRQTEQRRAHSDAIVEAIVIEGRRRLGLENIELDADYLLDLLEKRDWSLDDFEENVLLFVKRFNWKQLAGTEDEAKKKLDQQQRELEAFDVAEATRHRAAMTKMEEMRYEIARSRDTWSEAFEARHCLESTSAPVADVAELQVQLSQTLSEISKLELAVNPRDAAGDNGTYWSHISLRPARLARQTRDMLAEKNVAYSDERKRELESQLAAAERRVGECHQRLVELHAQRSALNAKMTNGQDALAPENFTLIRYKPTMDEVAKKRAYEGGWNSTSGVTSTR